MVQGTFYPSIGTNGAIGNNGHSVNSIGTPIVNRISLPQGSQVLMICSLHLVNQLVKQLTIRTNGANRKACLTIVIFYQW